MAERSLNAIQIPDEESVTEYFELRKQMEEAENDLRAVITHPTHILPFLQSGRLLKIKDGDNDFGWGVLISYSKRSNKVGVIKCPILFLILPVQVKGPPNPVLETPQSQYLLDVLLECAVNPKGTQTGNKEGSGTLIPVSKGSTGVPLVVPVMLSTVDAISHLRIHLPKDLRPLNSREIAWKAVQEIRRRWPKAVPLLDPIENMGIKDGAFKTLVQVSSLVFCPSPLTASYRKCKYLMTLSKPTRSILRLNCQSIDRYTCSGKLPSRICVHSNNASSRPGTSSSSKSSSAVREFYGDSDSPLPMILSRQRGE